MRKHIFILTLVLVTFSFASCQQQKQREISTKTYSGIIYPKHPFKTEPAYTPSNREVEEIEKLIQEELTHVLSIDHDTSAHTMQNKSNIVVNFLQYKRRYFGWINSANEKLMLIEFVHPIAIGKTDDWKSPKWSMDGGAYLFWSVEYNHSQKKFDRL